MFYPEGRLESSADPRARVPDIACPITREEVGKITAFDAKNAGDLGEKNMRKMGIDWVAFRGEQMKYWSKEKGESRSLFGEKSTRGVAVFPNLDEIEERT